MAVMARLTTGNIGQILVGNCSLRWKMRQRDINKLLDTILDLMIQRGIDQRLLDREQVLKSQLSDIESQLSALTSDEEGIDEYPHIHIQILTVIAPNHKGGFCCFGI
jgi:uncharacterized protein (DUF342 family)